MSSKIDTITGFEWDAANRDKNLLKHQVTNSECEEVFFHQPLLVESDVKHSIKEFRYYALGVTTHGRNLFLSFTIRENRIRMISARDMNKKERAIYAKQKTA